MLVQVRYFQSVRKVTGKTDESIDLNAPATLGGLVDQLVLRYPSLAPLTPSLLFAVNEEHSSPERTLYEGDRIAIMPPFSGG